VRLTRNAVRLRGSSGSIEKRALRELLRRRHDIRVKAIRRPGVPRVDIVDDLREVV